jgi:hypothetical protein
MLAKRIYLRDAAGVEVLANGTAHIQYARCGAANGMYHVLQRRRLTFLEYRAQLSPDGRVPHQVCLHRQNLQL